MKNCVTYRSRTLRMLLPLCLYFSMLRLPVVSRSLFPAAITKGGAAATNNGNKLPFQRPIY